jgi:hypothetical protein
MLRKGRAGGMGLCYYSTNPWIKWYIQNKWRGDVHFVWCSDVFDPGTVGTAHHGSLVPPTSSPCAIYKDLADAVRPGRTDRHNSKITEQRAGIVSRAEAWRRSGEVTNGVADEILAIVHGGDLSIWRPELYIIPKTAIDETRVELVPYQDRAGLGDEFRIRDLRGSEFDRVTFDGF